MGGKDLESFILSEIWGASAVPTPTCHFTYFERTFSLIIQRCHLFVCRRGKGLASFLTHCNILFRVCPHVMILVLRKIKRGEEPGNLKGYVRRDKQTFNIICPVCMPGFSSSKFEIEHFLCVTVEVLFCEYVYHFFLYLSQILS